MRTVTVTYYIQEHGSVPMIRLRGKWLTVVGFTEGRLVTIEMSIGKLVLTVKP